MLKSKKLLSLTTGVAITVLTVFALFPTTTDAVTNDKATIQKQATTITSLTNKNKALTDTNKKLQAQITALQNKLADAPQPKYTKATVNDITINSQNAAYVTQKGVNYIPEDWIISNLGLPIKFDSINNSVTIGQRPETTELWKIHHTSNMKATGERYVAPIRDAVTLKGSNSGIVLYGGGGSDKDKIPVITFDLNGEWKTFSCGFLAPGKDKQVNESGMFYSRPIITVLDISNPDEPVILKTATLTPDEKVDVSSVDVTGVTKLEITMTNDESDLRKDALGYVIEPKLSAK